MPNIYIDNDAERLIDSVLKKDKGLMVKTHKWTVLRIALALSLKIHTEPDENLDSLSSTKDYDLEQVTGKGKEEDYTDSFCALLCVYHKENLFNNEKRFHQLLQRHIRRGLREIRTSWKDSHDFHEYLYQELFSDISSQSSVDSDFGKKIIEALREIDVKGEIRDKKDGPRITRFLIYLSDVNDLDRLRKGVDKISFLLGLQKQGVFLQPTDVAKVVGLDIPRSPDSWHKITGANLIEWINQTSNQNMILPVCPGVDVLGNPFVFDIAKAPHILVGGTTGSGKSVCLHTFILSLLLKYDPDRLKLCLIDPKRVEFIAYSHLPHHIYGDVITDTEKASYALERLVNEMEDRESKLSAEGIRDLSEREAKGYLNLSRIVVFVEELADLFMQSRSIETPLVRLAQKGRATGIHLVLSTQRPDAETFSGLLRSNIPSRIALTVQKASESKIILDEIGAERLSGHGDMLIKLSGSEVIRVHGIDITQDDIAMCVNTIRRNRI